MKFSAIVLDTFQECLGKKILLIYFLISTLLLLTLLFLLRIDINGMTAVLSGTFDTNQSSMSLDTLQKGLMKVQGGFSAGLYAVGLFLSVFAMADLIPGMMAKGRLDLYLARPISRSQLLLGKFVGAAAIIAANVLYTVLGIWLIIGIKTGIWTGGLLYGGLSIIFMFCIVYAFMMLFGILSRSTAVTIILTYVIMALSPALAQRDVIDMFIWNDAVKLLIDGLYWALPKYHEVTKETYNLASGAGVQSWTPFISSLLTGLVVFQGTALVFSRKDI